MKSSQTYNLNRMRSYSSVFSSMAFAKMMKDGDMSFIQAKIKRYDSDNFQKGKFSTYLEYINYIYRELVKTYRNEYVYKNTFINNMLLKEYGVKDTIAINEFKVGNSVADIVLFNGISRAFEIKTELDSNKRLKDQIADYCKVFDECYIVTDENLIDKYAKEDPKAGLIKLEKRPRSVAMTEVRKPIKNDQIDPHTVIRCLRTEEYKSVVKKHYGELPEINSFNMFEVCSELIEQIPQKQLSMLFIDVLKKRKSNTSSLMQIDKELRQVALAMNINLQKYQQILNLLNEPINI